MYTNELPPSFGKVMNFQAVQFRVSVNFADARNLEGLAQDFSVVLTDAAGAASSVRVSEFFVSTVFSAGLGWSGAENSTEYSTRSVVCICGR